MMLMIKTIYKIFKKNKKKAIFEQRFKKKLHGISTAKVTEIVLVSNGNKRKRKPYCIKKFVYSTNKDIMK